MIKAIYANKSSFKRVDLKEGLNIILADKTEQSTVKDSRNGAGKSTLIEIIHFCLGASLRNGESIRVDGLKEWIFFMDLIIQGEEITVSREIADPRKIYLKGNVDNLNIQYKTNDKNEKYILVKEWTTSLGYLMFGLTPEEQELKYSPSFRGLISYFVRRKKGAFLNPFSHFPQQREWDIQVSNAFLLDLNWEYARRWQTVKDNEKTLDQLKKASNSGLVKGVMGGSIGELEAQKVRLETQAIEFKAQLDNFKIHPQYKDIEDKADALTTDIHKDTNDNISDRKLISFYEKSLEEEGTNNKSMIISIYEESKIHFPDLVKRKIEQVEEFHDQVVKNRKEFLQLEIERLKKDVTERDTRIKSNSDKRAEYLQILSDYGALEEHTKLQQQYVNQMAKINEIDNALDSLRTFEQGKSSLKIEKEVLQQEARNDYYERLNQRTKAIQLFNLNSQALYAEPGELLIDIGKTGFKFNVHINKAGSEGIEHMKVFCYDLMLSQIWSGKPHSTGFLVHDSSIFDPVDERQVESAVKLAKKESHEKGFQYICLLNSDKIQIGDELESFVRLRLTDNSDEGGLLGIRVQSED
ncbi:ABC-three component system protein [Priestia megaterium]|uniref:ABC-three component system protein n=1 Tax=Priestia megaterium TaxID=1404 RepID=UPI003009965C